MLAKSGAGGRWQLELALAAGKNRYGRELPRGRALTLFTSVLLFQELEENVFLGMGKSGEWIERVHRFRDGGASVAPQHEDRTMRRLNALILPDRVAWLNRAVIVCDREWIGLAWNGDVRWRKCERSTADLHGSVCTERFAAVVRGRHDQIQASVGVLRVIRDMHFIAAFLVFTVARDREARMNVVWFARCTDLYRLIPVSAAIGGAQEHDLRCPVGVAEGWTSRSVPR